jgi:ABC-type multidrug transport system fused ATPase/permease subunit
MTKAEGSSSLGFFSFKVAGALGRYERSSLEGGAGRHSARRLGVFVAATVVQAGANGAMAASAGLLGQALVGRQLVARLALVDSLPWLFSPLTLCFVGAAAAVVKAGAGAIAIYAQKRTAFRVGDALRRQVADAVLAAGGAAEGDAPPEPALRVVPAELHATIAVRLRDVERGVDEGLLGGARAVATLLPLAGTLVALSWRLAIGALLALGAFGLALGGVRGRGRARHARAATLAESLHANVDELVRHLDLWRTYGAEQRVRAALEAAGEAVGIAAARAETSRALASGGNEAAAALALLAAVALVERGGLELGEGPLVAFAAVFFLMYRPLRDLGDARTFVERGAAALRALDAVGRGASAPPTRAAPSPVAAWGREPLRVVGVSVRHGDRATAPASFSADPGEIVAVVGETGAGKTSLLRALLGLERDATGTVRYGERSLGAAGVGPGERPFAWVPQEPAIVAGTIAANVALGVRLDGAEVDGRGAAREALIAIGAHALVGREGELLSAGGPELSGGERQWIAIARALSTGLPVLLLDEPTAGLDAPSQERVLGALAALRGKRTIVLVTHRPEPLALASRVVRLEPLTPAEEKNEAPARSRPPGPRPHVRHRPS